MHSTVFLLFISLASSVDQEAEILKIEYLEALVETELKKIESYNIRTDNTDLLGRAQETEVLNGE